MLGLLERDALVRLCDLGIALAVGLARHGEIHADFAALAVEMVLESLRDLCIVDDAVTDMVLCDELKAAALLQELRSRNAALGALLRRILAFVHIPANGANPLSHVFISF